MAFVNEKINELDAVNANWEQYQEYRGWWNPPHPSYWTIDRDRNFVFWRIKGPIPEFPNERYRLRLNDENIHIEAIKSYNEEKIGGKFITDIYWDVVKLGIPELLKAQETGIREIISDAFEAYGDVFNRTLYRNVFTSFNDVAIEQVRIMFNPKVGIESRNFK